MEKQTETERERDRRTEGDAGSRITISVDAVFAIAFLHIANYLVEGRGGEGGDGTQRYLSSGKLFSVLNKINVDV